MSIIDRVPALLLTQAQVELAASVGDAVRSVEAAFAAVGRGEATMPPKVYLNADGGDFRAMPARLGKAAGLKWVNVHPANKAAGLPTVMGVYVLNDPATGALMAIMDATLLTALRTGAAAAVASKYLASKAPATIGIIGCGVQARTLVDAHRVVFGDGFKVLAADRNSDAAQSFASEVSGNAVPVQVAAGADIVCTATPSRDPFVELAWLKPGAHINAMGADAEGKQELHVNVLKSAAVYIDDREQAAHSGEINVPIAAGSYALSEIAGTLGEVVAGTLRCPDSQQTTVFDSTGLAVQDVALAQVIYDTAVARGIGKTIDMLG